MKRLPIALLAALLCGAIVLNAAAAGATTKRITIVHVRKGCHVWSMSSRTTA
jgi:hypothetical protein